MTTTTGPTGKPGLQGASGTAGEAGFNGGNGRPGGDGGYSYIAKYQTSYGINQYVGPNGTYSDALSPIIGGVGGAGGRGGNGGGGIGSVYTYGYGYGRGARGGNGGSGGAGGVGVVFTGQLTNKTQITGGLGGAGAESGVGGGGASYQIYTYNGLTTKTGYPGQDGNSGAGGAGGAGVVLGLNPPSSSLENKGAITGGAGGTGSNTQYYLFRGDAGAGGAGGIGVDLSGGGARFANDAGASIVGGKGGAGGNDGSAYVTYNPLRFHTLKNGGVGGAGLVLAGTDTGTNAGSITGGAGGGAGLSHYVGNLVKTPAGYGPGGAGVDLYASAALTNTGTITGGVSDLVGGVGVQLDGGTLTNSGTISGGKYGYYVGSPSTLTMIADSVDFGAGSGTLIVESGAKFNGAIGGFAVGDKIDITNLTPAQVLQDFGATGVALSGGSFKFTGAAGGDTLTTPSDGTLALKGDFSTDEFLLASDGHGGTDITLYCFVGGTRILTPDGETPVEALEPGDLVVLSDGSAEPVRWIGVQTVLTRSVDPTGAYPIRVRTGALGGGLPVRDLLVSPGHALFLDGVLVNAAALINGESIVRETRVPERLKYFHIELSMHALLVAEGAFAESYLDAAEPTQFDNERDRVLILGGGAPPTEMPFPRAKSRRQVPSALHKRLQAEAALLAGGHEAGVGEAFFFNRSLTARRSIGLRRGLVNPSRIGITLAA